MSKRSARFSRQLELELLEDRIVPVTLAPIPDQTVPEQQLLTVNVSSYASGYDTPVVYSLDESQPGASINSTTGVFTWTPPEESEVTEFDFTVHAAEYEHESYATQTFQVLVVPPVPVLQPIADQTVARGAILTVQAVAQYAEPTADGITYYLKSGPEGAVINTQTGLFQWIPSLRPADRQLPGNRCCLQLQQQRAGH